MQKKSLALALMIALSGCVNLSTVRDFAKLSSDATANSAVFDGYPDAAREFARMAPPSAKARVVAIADQAEDRAKVQALGVKTLSLYFAALSALADDKTATDVQSSASSIVTSLGKLNVIPSSTSTAVSALANLLASALLDGWRRSAVANLIDQANEPVQRICMDLAADAEGIELVSQENALSANIYYRNFGAQNADPAVREMLDEWRLSHIASYQKLEKQAVAARQVFQKIGEAQRQLQANKSHLNSAELKALLTKYGSDIFSAAKLLPLGLP